MKSASRILMITLALGTWASADVPKKAPITRYTGLWTDSPFTSKPPPAEVGPAANPLEDYALGGVSPVGNGYRVTLLNKKKPEDRITVDSDRTNKDGFKILQVTRKSGDPLGTVVRMSSGALIGTVAFDEKLLTIAPPPAAAKPNPQGNQPQIPGQPPQPQQPQLQNGQPPRQPRPRVVPPPTPGAAPQPQVQPQVQPTQNLQRADRRGGR